MAMELTNLTSMLFERSTGSGAYTAGLYFYSPGVDDPEYLPYQDLWTEAARRSRKIQGLTDLKNNPVIILHLEDHRESILWFWAIITAGAIPCLSTPLTNDMSQREKHMTHLQRLLGYPLIIASDKLEPQFDNIESFALHIETIEDIDSILPPYDQDSDCPGFMKNASDTAVLMLTSGSTGTSKAVALSHANIISALQGKQQMHNTAWSDVFLNWTSFSHVANLTEIHLHALYLLADQIHLPGEEVVANPISFLQIISKHKVSYTFAPNFLLASLVRFLESEKHMSISEEWVEKKLEGFNALAVQEPDTVDVPGGTKAPLRLDLNLSCLRALISGGESNVVETCDKLTKMLQAYRAPSSFIRPGFGMTETCAGSIYARDCPAYDLAQNSEFASLGRCIPGMEIRVVGQDEKDVSAGEIGSLQVRGLNIFTKYYNDKKATDEAFTPDFGRWFKTGDVAKIDSTGQLHIVGRDKDTIVVNGVNHYPHAIEGAIEEAQIPGVTPTYTVAFSIRPRRSHTELLIIVYLPTPDNMEPAYRVKAAFKISKTCVVYCGVRPFKIIPLPKHLLQKSSLGKLSRSKVRNAYEMGEYKQYDQTEQILSRRLQSVVAEPAKDLTATEKTILSTYHALFSTYAADINRGTSLFELGISSIDLLKLRVALQEKLKIQFPITIFFSNSSIRELAICLDLLKRSTIKYNPIVQLQRNGSKTPLFVIHPGVGEVLIFMNLARHITDTRVYALRARGFDGEPFFESIPEMVATYLNSIKRVQPLGPYAFLGYSFGSILAFEIAKILESQGEEVKFLGCLDQPPHFKKRARGYDWYECVLTLSFFLGLIEERDCYDNLVEYRKIPKHELLMHILAYAPQSRVEELGITMPRLENWANLALQLKRIAWDYDPAGLVSKMDIFYTVPLVGLVPAKNREEWLNGFISNWSKFVKDAKYHFVGGGHRTLILPPNLMGFMKTFRKALEARGL